jgi:hypothetical protein
MQEADRLLLGACLADPRSFRTAVANWETATDIQQLNAGLTRLIPFLYKRAVATKTPLCNKEIIRGTYRRYWVRRELLQSTAREVIPAISSLESPVLLKGAALEEVVYHEDPVTRPYDDIDLLVSREEFLSVIEWLPKRGWVNERIVPNEILATLSHGASFSNSGLAIDFHWVIFPFNLDPHYELRLRLRSSEISKFGRSFLLPCPTDLLLHTIIHGQQDNQVSPARWALDASILIQNTEIDWPLFIQEAKSCGWAYELGRALGLLRAMFNINQIPPEVVQTLESAKASYSSRLVFSSYRSQNIWKRRVVRFLWTNYLIYKTSLYLDNLRTYHVLTWFKSLQLGFLAVTHFAKANGFLHLFSGGDWAKRQGQAK